MEAAGSGPDLQDVERMPAIRVFEERLPELSAAGRRPGTTHPPRAPWRPRA
ncbi:hypothetical protein AB4039_00820 [Streptomyces sp. M-16]|uniref:hypothetical protein n=1 Tax=Streptomyces sp. M-16 TaxID=3233040 RepID=UPI002256CE7D